MGYLYCGSGHDAFAIEDRALAHVKESMLVLLRQGHGVAFSATTPTAQGSGRDTVWISPTTDVRFLFFGGRLPAINEVWVRSLVSLALSPTGMYLIAEPSRLRDVAPSTP